MTVEEIFTELANHMIKGIMLHEQLSEYYDFLGLEGYRKCHEYRFFDECVGYKKFVKYYTEHNNKLIEGIKADSSDIIPSSWYKYHRQDVDANTKRNAVKNGLKTWVEWETETKKLYESEYKELMELDKVADAKMVGKLVEDVDHELKRAEQYWLNKTAIDFDLVEVVQEQHKKKEKYKHKLKCLGDKL